MKNETRDAIEEGASKLRDAADGVARKAGDAMGQVRNYAGPLVDQAQAGYRQLAERAQEGFRDVNEVVRRNPGTSVVAALGVGLACGVMVALAVGSRRDNYWRF